MNYQTANDQLTGRCSTRRKIANNTYLERNGDDINIRLHNTVIMTFKPNGDVSFDSGGWRTVTTKQRMNEFQNIARFYTDRGIWYMRLGQSWSDNAKQFAFDDGIMVHSDGSVTGEGEDPAKLLKLKRRIKTYVEGYLKAFVAGSVPAPSNGDCWYCLMITQNGQSLGEVNHYTSHLDSHLDEKYYVPSMLIRAVKRFRVAPVGQHALAIAWSPESPSRYPEGITKAFGGTFEKYGLEQLTKSLRRYITEQYGMQA